MLWAAGLSIGINDPASALGGSDPFTFSAPITIEFEEIQFPSHLAAADLDGDGNLDIVVTGRNTEGLVQILFGKGDGTFADPQPLVIGAQTDWVEIVDMDADGHLDLVLAFRSSIGRVAVVRGNGDGTFQEKFDEYIVGRSAQSLVVADLNGDGHSDIVSGQFNSGTIRTLLNDGSGQFSLLLPMVINPFVAGTIGVHHLASGDLNDDGKLDLVVTTLGGGRINVLFGNGDGTFQRETAYRLPLIGGALYGSVMAAVGDVSGDGRLDIVVPMTSTQGPQRFGVFENPGGGVFDPPQVFPSATAQYVWSNALADFDGDGRLDVVFGVAIGSQITLVRNLTIDTLAFSQPQIIPNVESFPRYILPVDLNDDGAPDLVIADIAADVVRIRLNLTPQGGGGVLAGRVAQGPDATVDASMTRGERPSRKFDWPDLTGRSIAEVLLKLERVGGAP